MQITMEQFESVCLVVGTVVSARRAAEVRNPSYRVEVDFGAEVGTLKTVAQITDLYDPEELPGRQVIGLVNVPSKQIGPVTSQFLLTGFYRDDGVVLAVPDQPVPNGARLA